MTGASAALLGSGFVWIRSALPSAAAAFAKAEELVEECAALDGHDELTVIGNFILPPPDGEPTRDFQTLHFDFGIPLRPLRDQDVARYTALLIPRSAVGVTAMTRLVPLRALLGRRPWPDQATLLNNIVAYGNWHGAWDDADGYRRVASDALSRRRPARRASRASSTPPVSVRDGVRHLAAELSSSRPLGWTSMPSSSRSRCSRATCWSSTTSPWHGRRGSRRPGELHQRVYGFRCSPRRISAHYVTGS